MIRYAGAVYLFCWRDRLGVRRVIWRRTLRLVSAARAIRRGFVTNVLNPKTALFIFAFIPQFTDPAIGPIWMQIVVLGAIFMLFGMMFSLCLGAASGAFAHVLRARARLLSRLSAVMFGGLAARLIWD